MRNQTIKAPKSNISPQILERPQMVKGAEREPRMNAFLKPINSARRGSSIKASEAISALGQVSWWWCSAGAPNTTREGACAPHIEHSPAVSRSFARLEFLTLKRNEFRAPLRLPAENLCFQLRLRLITHVFSYEVMGEREF